METRSLRFRVAGMTCAACEKRVEEALLALPGVESADADRGRGRVTVSLSGPEPAEGDLGRLRAAVETAGYAAPAGGGSSGLREAAMGLAIGALLSVAYLAADRSGLFQNLPLAGEGLGLGALFVLGLLTSVHCLAMCGGIVIGQSGGGAELPGGAAARLRPALLYNAGRVTSYAATGAVAGAFGAAFDFSPRAKAAIMGAAALLMLVYGFRNLGILRAPARPGRGATGLSALGRRLGLARVGAAAGRGPLVVGFLNGLMPCGPLQSMQIFALGTGSVLAGAASMLAFGLGTAPLLLGLGAAASLVPRRALPVAVRASGVLILVLGVSTGARAAALAGIVMPGFGSATEPRAGIAAAYPLAGASDGTTAEAFLPETWLAGGEGLGPAAACPCCAGDTPPVEGAAGADSLLAPATGLEGLAQTVQARGQAPIAAVPGNGIQTVVTPIGPRSYPPFTVKLGVPVRWIIRARAEDLNGCNNAIVIPSLGIRQALKPGDTVVEFTPRKAGAVAFSCWMGMITSRFVVQE